MVQRRKVIVMLLAIIALAATSCGGGEAPEGGGATPGADAGETCEPTGTALEVSASGIRFDESCLAAPAGEPFTIEFTNNDEGIPHNVAIYTDDSATESLFVGEIFQGVETRTYEIPAPDPGTYFFHCDVHPNQMTGTFVVK